jgi:hypothetical protein
MRHLLIGVTAVATLVVIAPVWAQVPRPWAPGPTAAYSTQPYPFPSVTPEDAYREGLINRWELEQFAGPTPQAMQGPSVDGSKGSSSGGRR